MVAEQLEGWNFHFLRWRQSGEEQGFHFNSQTLAEGVSGPGKSLQHAGGDEGGSGLQQTSRPETRRSSWRHEAPVAAPECRHTCARHHVVRGRQLRVQRGATGGCSHQVESDSSRSQDCEAG